MPGLNRTRNRLRLPNQVQHKAPVEVTRDFTRGNAKIIQFYFAHAVRLGFVVVSNYITGKRNLSTIYYFYMQESY